MHIILRIWEIGNRVQGSGLAHGTYRPLIVDERGGSGFYGVYGVSGFKGGSASIKINSAAKYNK